MRSSVFIFFILLLSQPIKAQVYADFTMTRSAGPIGSFRVLLETEKSPLTCANFIGLATGKRPWIDPETGQLRENTPYFDGVICHRLIHNFVLQGGDPLGSGSGGPGYLFEDEFDPTLRHDGPYILSMANSGPNTNGSQFFITLAATPNLNDVHSIFGTVIGDGRTIIDGFMDNTQYPTEASNPPNNRPIDPITIQSVVITGPDADTFDVLDPSLRIPTLTSQPVNIQQNDPATPPALEFTQTENTTFSLGLSPDLSTWDLTDRYLGKNASPESTFTIPAGLQSRSDRHFYHTSLITYPGSAPYTSSLQGKTFTATTSIGPITVTFLTDPNTTANPAGTIAIGTTTGSFPSYTFSPNGFGARLFLSAGNLVAFSFNLAADTETPDSVTGRVSGTAFNAAGSRFSGNYSLNNTAP